MPLESILFLALVIAALTVFAAALAYADWATRHAIDDTPRRAQKRDQQPPPHREETPLIHEKAA